MRIVRIDSFGYHRLIGGFKSIIFDIPSQMCQFSQFFWYQIACRSHDLEGQHFTGTYDALFDFGDRQWCVNASVKKSTGLCDLIASHSHRVNPTNRGNVVGGVIFGSEQFFRILYDTKAYTRRF